MKNTLILVLLLIIAGAAAAQTAVEKEIRRLDQLEAQATIKGDTAALGRLWSPDYVVNNPANRIVNVQQIRQLMKEGKIDYGRFSRVIEKVTISKDVAIAMGYEVVEPEARTDNAGKKVTRRYTDVWQKTSKGWQIIARQATIISIE